MTIQMPQSSKKDELDDDRESVVSVGRTKKFTKLVVVSTTANVCLTYYRRTKSSGSLSSINSVHSDCLIYRQKAIRYRNRSSIPYKYR